MIIVRETFITKPGMASKFAKLMKEVMGPNARVMTDLTGRFNHVVVETEMKSLQDFQKRMDSYKKDKDKDKKTQEKMAGYTEMYMTGKREIYQIL